MFKNRMPIFLTVLLVTILVSGCLSGTSKQSQQPEPKKASTGGKIIKIASVLNDQHPANANGTFKFKEIVEAKTKGKYEIQVYSGNQLGDDVKATQNVRAGSIEMVLTSAAPVTGMAAEFMVFDLPFILTNDKAVDAIFDGPVGKKLAAKLDDKGLHLLAYYENGFRQLTNSAREVKTPADLKGRKAASLVLAAFLLVRLPENSRQRCQQLQSGREHSSGICGRRAALGAGKIAAALAADRRKRSF